MSSRILAVAVLVRQAKRGMIKAKAIGLAILLALLAVIESLNTDMLTEPAEKSRKTYNLNKTFTVDQAHENITDKPTLITTQTCVSRNGKTILCVSESYKSIVPLFYSVQQGSRRGR
jgi:hypothetical protein